MMRSVLSKLKSRFPIELEATPHGVELAGRQSRSATTIHGLAAAILGPPFAAAGVAMLGVAAGLIALPQTGSREIPVWLVAPLGAVFTWAGVSMFAHGLRGAVRSLRARKRRQAHPAEPWRWDHVWDERGATDDAGSRARQSFATALFMVVFLVPFHWIGFVARDGSLVFGIVALLFDLVVVALLWRGVYLLAHRMKYGAGRAIFARFPFRRGSPLELHVIAPAALPQHAIVTATLRCIQERYVRRGTGEDATVSVACIEVHRDTAPAPIVSIPSGGRALRVRFDLPADVPTTDLASRPCRYWEIDVEASTDGVDYAARYLVPIY